MDRTDKTRYETVYIRDEISRCEDVIELKRKIIPMIKTQHDQWTEKINDLIAESGFTKTRFAELLGVSRMAVNKWCNGANDIDDKNKSLLGEYSCLPAS